MMEFYKRFNSHCAIWLYPAVIALFEYTGVQSEQFAILGVVMIFDFITGISKTVALGIKPTSKRGLIGLVSKMCILILPMILAIVIKGAFGTDASSIVRAMISMLILAEGYSVIQNIVSIKQRKNIEEFDAMTQVMNWILKKMKDLIESKIKE